MREKYLVPCTNPEDPDAPFIMIDREPSVKVARILATKMAELHEGARDLLEPCEEKGDVDDLEPKDKIRVLNVNTEFLLHAMACGIAKFGGNWDLYIHEWGEASPAWPRVIRSDADYDARMETASNIDQKTALAVADKINGFMKLGDKEAEK